MGKETEKMVKVKRDNRVLILTEDEAESYLAKGYTVYDIETGEVIAEPDRYKSELREAKKQIASLTAEIEMLKREKNMLFARLKASGK